MEIISKNDFAMPTDWALHGNVNL